MVENNKNNSNQTET